MDIVRAWKDAAYRRTLAAEGNYSAIENPAGPVELSSIDLDGVSGGTETGVGCVAVSATIGLTVSVCSPSGTGCGSCSFGTAACC